jgi:AcrR family transcriptional regulator
MTAERAPKEKWTPERRRQLTRDALIDAASEVFARRGYEGASLDEIAETAGFTRGAIYKNFSDKEDLFVAVSERLNERTLQEFAGIHDDPEVILKPEHISEVAAKWREIQTGDAQFFMLGLEFNLYLLRNPEARARVIPRRRENARRVAEYMKQEADAAGYELPIPIEDLANIFLITSDGFTAAALAEPELARLYEPFLDLMIRGMASYLPPQPAGERP